MVLAWGADYQTRTGEQREITLTDGSQVWLNTRSAISVHYHAGARLLKLVAGEILVHTAHDTNSRPFYVETRSAACRRWAPAFPSCMTTGVHVSMFLKAPSRSATQPASATRRSR